MQLSKINADATINSGVKKKRCGKKKLSTVVDSCKPKNLVQSDRKKRITSEIKSRFSDNKEETELHPAFTPAEIRNKSILSNSKKLTSVKRLPFGANTPVNKSTFHSNKKSTTVHKLNTQNLSSGKKSSEFSSSKRSSIASKKYQNNEKVPSKSRLTLDGTKKTPKFRPESSEDCTLTVDGTKRHKPDAHSPPKHSPYKIPQMPVVPGYTSDYEKMVQQYFATEGLKDVGANLTYMDNKLLEKVTNTVTRRNDEINQFRRVSAERDRIVPVEDLAKVLKMKTDYHAGKESMNIFGENFAEAFNDENYMLDDTEVFMQNLEKARKREVLLKVRAAPVLEEPMPKPIQKVSRKSEAKTKDQEIIVAPPPMPIAAPPAAATGVSTSRKVEPAPKAQTEIVSRPEPTKEPAPSREQPPRRKLQPSVKPGPSKPRPKDEPDVTKKEVELADQELPTKQTSAEVVLLGFSQSGDKAPNISRQQNKNKQKN